MTGYRKKIIFTLFVYFAGFATAIYFLAPPSTAQYSARCEISSASSPLNSQFVQAFNSGMHKCVDFMKDAAVRIGSFLKQKYEEKTTQASQACDQSASDAYMDS